MGIEDTKYPRIEEEATGKCKECSRPERGCTDSKFGEICQDFKEKLTWDSEEDYYSEREKSAMSKLDKSLFPDD